MYSLNHIVYLNHIYSNISLLLVALIVVLVMFVTSYAKYLRIHPNTATFPKCLLLLILLVAIGGCTYTSSIMYDKSSNMHIAKTIIHKQHKSNIYRKELSYYRSKYHYTRAKYLYYKNNFGFWSGNHIKADYYLTKSVYNRRVIRHFVKYINHYGNVNLVKKRILALQH